MFIRVRTLTDSENGIKLLNLAKEKNWSVTIRKRTRIGTGHLYEKYSR